jgi:hypothetical protein
MKKQTAVEWLVDELRKHIQEHGRLNAITIYQLKMKAKAMEKEQIVEALKDSWNLAKHSNYDNPHAEQYYNQTYGS